MDGIKMWLSSQAEDFFDTGIQRLIPPYKCLSSGGEDAEKQLKYVCTYYFQQKQDAHNNRFTMETGCFLLGPPRGYIARTPGLLSAVQLSEVK
jgi:hypothetical protein